MKGLEPSTFCMASRPDSRDEPPASRLGSRRASFVKMPAVASYDRRESYARRTK
jgi:hypothetical protein